MKSNMKTIAKTIFLFCLGILIYQIFKNIKYRNELLQRGKITNGKVYEVNQQGSKYKTSVCYMFRIEEQVFKNCKQYHLSGSLEDRLVGVNVPIIYDSTDPNVNQVLLYESDFQTYHINYPDSLQWIENLR